MVLDTFHFAAIVPERSGATEFECRGDLCEPLVTARRLSGVAPLIRVTDAGLTPDPGPHLPWVMRSRITLCASEGRQSTAAETWFHVDRALTSCMRRGDELHLTRTASAGIGLSVIRSGELIVAAGAVTSVPLGQSVRARTPLDLIADAEAVFRKGDPAFEFPVLPLEVIVDSRMILYGGQQTIGDYRVFVVHGYLRGVPGTDACAAIYHHGKCPDTAAHASAMLMAGPGADSGWGPIWRSD